MATGRMPLARLICLEEAIYLLLQSTECEGVSDQVRAQPEVGTSFGIALGRTIARSTDAVLRAIQSHIQSQAKKTGGKYLLPG